MKERERQKAARERDHKAKDHKRSLNERAREKATGRVKEHVERQISLAEDEEKPSALR